MSTELYFIGIVLTGLISAIVGGLVGSHVTLSRVADIATQLRQDKPWEQAVQALFASVPANIQTTLTQGANALNAIDNLVQDIVKSGNVPTGSTSTNGTTTLPLPSGATITVPSSVADKGNG